MELAVRLLAPSATGWRGSVTFQVSSESSEPPARRWPPGENASLKTVAGSAARALGCAGSTTPYRRRKDGDALSYSERSATANTRPSGLNASASVPAVRPVIVLTGSVEGSSVRRSRTTGFELASTALAAKRLASGL